MDRQENIFWHVKLLKKKQLFKIHFKFCFKSDDEYFRLEIFIIKLGFLS